MNPEARQQFPSLLHAKHEISTTMVLCTSSRICETDARDEASEQKTKEPNTERLAGTTLKTLSSHLVLTALSQHTLHLSGIATLKG